jgi:sugar phosphate isomerase/epimerase
MKIGAYTACLHDRPLEEALGILVELGLTSAEINAGGFVPAPHLPIERLRASAAAREEYLGLFEQAGIALTGLNVNGNPLNPLPDVGPKHAEDLRRVVNPWDSQYLDVLDYQWREVAIPFWRDIDARARTAGVTVCIEMHPHNVVFNPSTLERLVTEIDATNVGAEMDPSHLFWQGIDPIGAIERLGSLVRHAAAKDTLIHEENCRYYGVLDDRHTRVPPEENPVGLGGRNTLNRWPDDAAWEFVAVGRGHDVGFWARFLRALHAVDPDIAVNIEHEDRAFDQVEGLRRAAETLTTAAAKADVLR